ncbi:MAG: hypothetical protein DWI57_10760 [Chloroflexi bacterium]|nr:MAG: hypothetical protein DWI57_10760 [Chloroflexota bacterium]
MLIGKTAGDSIKANQPAVNATLKLKGSVAPDTSYRWLSGEDDPAFNGAIRDLWTPTCFGHPGKVTDTQYHCSVSDGGGVHSNSGIPNHGFALLVDGGNYNGQSIQPLGLTKAAHIYWRTMTTYQNQASGFADHADSLQAACSDLVGHNLLSLTTGLPSGESISQADCGQVTKVISAIELRTPPTQCNFQPLLKRNAPNLCAAPGGTATTVFFDNFESQPLNWSLTNSGVYSEYRPSDWAWVATLPGGRGGSAFFGVDAFDVGNCVPGSDDQSGAKFMESPAITIPANSPFARLAFDHYVATEAEWDGGNLQIQVNDGDWQLVEPAAFDFNPYNSDLIGSSNPLAYLPAFSGSDGGGLSGSWGQSQVDLSAYAQQGDTVKLRFALGIDGCGGLDGWYVDDVRLYFCPAEAGPAVHLTFADGASGVKENLVGIASGTQTFSVTNRGLTELSWSIGEDSDVAARQAMPDGWSDQLRRAPNPQFSAPLRRPKLAQSKNVVQDGSFEAGSPNPFWAESSTTFAPPLCDPASCGRDLAQDGSWYAWFGGWGALHQSALTQTVTITASAIAELSFWVLTGDVSGSDTVIASLDGAPLFVVDVNNADDFEAGYVQVKVDVSSYANGGEHILALTGSTVGNIIIDNVVLRDEPPLCANPKNVPWLSVSPSSGSLAKGQSADVTVAFNATGLSGTLHEAALCITTNDKRNPKITVPVHLSVEPVAAWTQTVFVNSVEYTGTRLITGINASDTITVLDRIVVTSSGTISFSLRYGWTESLVLMATKTSQAGSNDPVGTISSVRDGIDEWMVATGVSGTSYTIARTFVVAAGTKSVNRVSEHLVVEGVPQQQPQIGFTFQPMLYLYLPSVGR